MIVFDPTFTILKTRDTINFPRLTLPLEHLSLILELFKYQESIYRKIVGREGTFYQNHTISAGA